jgi:hypothetical protein
MHIFEKIRAVARENNTGKCTSASWYLPKWAKCFMYRHQKKWGQLL